MAEDAGTTNGGAAEAAQATGTGETPAQRERRKFPIRLMRATTRATGGEAWAPPGDGAFEDIDAAKRWIRDTGEDGATYLLARVISAERVAPRKVESVPWEGQA